jgi:hypothetical protein
MAEHLKYNGKLAIFTQVLWKCEALLTSFHIFIIIKFCPKLKISVGI